MARPRKEGMDYFPHDVHMSTDKKVKALRIMYGNDGYTFFNIALEMIYQEPNFELDVSDAETLQILASNVEVTVQKLSEMISTAIKHGCFDRERYTNEGVLTSNGILKRAEVVTKKRVAMRDKYDKKVSDTETTPEMPQSKSKVKDKVKVKDKGIKEVKEHRPEITELTDHFIFWITKNNPNAKIPPVLDKWNDEMDKLERIDKYDTMQIRSAIDWCQQDSFWKSNILSVPKLREKIPTLFLQMQRKQPSGNGKVSSFTRLQQLAREEQEREASGNY